jgi:hypothetical protein
VALTACQVPLGADATGLTGDAVHASGGRPASRAHPILGRIRRPTAYPLTGAAIKENLMTSTISRFGALTGPAAGVAFLAAFALSSAPPGLSAGGAATIAYYRAHSSGARASDALWALGLSLLVLFAGTLRTRLSDAPEAAGPATTALAGAAIMAAGGAVYFGCDFVLASMPATTAPAAAQAVNLLALQLVLPLAAGILVFGVAIGAAILRARMLPSWTGWVAVVLALTCLGGPFSLVAVGLWAGVVGILVTRRSPTTTRSSVPAVDAQPAT